MNDSNTRRTTIPRLWNIAALLLIVGFGLLLQGCSTEQAGLSVGDPAPEFTLPDAVGGSVSLADYEGEQPVLLFFHMAAG